MTRKIKWIGIVLAVTLLLSGCAMKTVDEMYCLPRRSEAFEDLQSLMDSAMYGMRYCAPVSGEHQQTVQMADVDGDNEQEFLVFAKANEEKPLRILIFDYQDGTVSLRDTICCNGSAFEEVEYVQMDDHAGLEIVVGRRLSDQMQRAVSVYSFRDGTVQKLLSTNYTRFLTVDLDENGRKELFILRPGESDESKGVATMYGVKNDTMERSIELSMSVPADNLKRLITGRLFGGQMAVFAAGTVDDTALITDVYTMQDGSLTNVTASSKAGTSVGTLRNHYIYALDIDYDGVIELPSLQSAQQGLSGEEPQEIVRWYALAPNGAEIDKMYTYHNFVDGWYLILEDRLVRQIAVDQTGSRYTFSIRDGEQVCPVANIEMFTGEDRETEPDDWFVLLRTESAVYMASLTQEARNYGITRETIMRSFCMIYLDWKTGET